MFYRWRKPNDILMMTDLANAYLDEDLFILGGHPSLSDLNLESLSSPGIMTMAMNNVPYVFPNPTFWLTADKPACYGGHFFHRADIIKFARLDASMDLVTGTERQMRTFPSLYLYELNGEKYNEGNFLTEGVDVAWWKSIFPISIQLAWRLGFRRLFFVGCSFWTSKKQPYAWPVKLTEAQKTSNQLVYNADIERLTSLKPHIDAMRLQLYSCTPDSRLNELMTFVPLDEAIVEVAKHLPKPTPLSRVYHSSAT